MSVQLNHVLHGLGNVAVALHDTGQRGDARLDEQVIILFTVTDGRIAAAVNLISDVPGLRSAICPAENGLYPSEPGN